jgi:adenylate kinase family enzyme
MVISFSDYISESIDGKMQVLDAICHVLKVNGKPLSMLEIWSEITRLNLLTETEFKRINNARKSGKVVGVYSGYLDTLLSRSSINTTRSDANGKNLFRIINIRPNVKYELVDMNEPEKIEINSKIKMTFINAAQLILKENDNRPMSSKEIWDIIDDRDLVETKGTTPWITLNADMLSYSDNSNSKYKKKRKIFTIVETNPAKFKLIKNEVQDVSDEELEDDFSDLEEIKPFGKFPQPFDVESELRKAQAQIEDDVLPFKNFRATEPNETPDELLVFNTYIKNPFSQAICVLGESGAGKSTTLDNILQKSGHIYQYIIPSASTTGLLSQFSPSAGAAGGYIPSRLGQMIEKAYNNKDVNYTAVFDECHKTSIIEMINDELLQAISKNRNKGVRFISLDDDTRRLYPSAQEDSRGNILIPDNFGFIFISSNARVIAGNPDFFNRVDLVEMTKEDQKMKTIEELNQKRVTSKEDKKELVNKIVSGGE